MVLRRCIGVCDAISFLFYLAMSSVRNIEKYLRSKISSYYRCFGTFSHFSVLIYGIQLLYISQIVEQIGPICGANQSISLRDTGYVKHWRIYCSINFTNGSCKFLLCFGQKLQEAKYLAQADSVEWKNQNQRLVIKQYDFVLFFYLHADTRITHTHQRILLNHRDDGRISFIFCPN